MLVYQRVKHHYINPIKPPFSYGFPMAFLCFPQFQPARARAVSVSGGVSQSLGSAATQRSAGRGNFITEPVASEAWEPWLTSSGNHPLSVRNWLVVTGT